MADLIWSNDLVKKLVEEYRMRPELWDTTHEMYRVQMLKYEAWRELASKFGCDIADLRKKLNSLFASHRREKAKVRAGGHSNWFLYKQMSFLPTHVEDKTPENHAIISMKRDRRTIAAALESEEEENEDEVEEERILENDDNDDDDEDDTPAVQAEILIKEEPVIPTYRAKPRIHQSHKPRLTRSIKRRVVKNYTTSKSSNQLDDRLSEAIKLLRKADCSRRKDACDSFGEYIADSLRKHDERTQSMIKQAINNILFEQEMKRYSVGNQYTVVISGMDENPLILEESDK